MKKIIGSVAILLALLSISGCGSSSGDSTLNGATPDNPAPNNPVQDKTSVLPKEDQPPVADIKNFAEINIQNDAFAPATLTIKKGTLVTWTNNDSAAHAIKSNLFNSGELAKGDTYKFLFNNPETFDYSCGIHPTITGKIIVE